MGKSARNAEYTKEYNRKMFLRLLRAKPMSRAEIARQMGLTRSAASLIADELLEAGIIAESSACETQRGRTPVPLVLRADAGCAVGVYLNRDGCTIGAVDFAGGVFAKRRIRLESGAPEGLNALAEEIKAIIRETNLPREKIIGVGVSAPGPLDGERGMIINPPRFDLWHNTEITGILSSNLDLPVYLENNATSLAQYNLDKPEANGSRNFLLLLVDSGVGSGIIADGQALKGAGSFTGELGHVTINYRGKKCACGNRGCLEAYAAIPNLLEGTRFESWKQVTDESDNESDARDLIKLEAEYLASGIASMANVISIDTVLLAGDLLYGSEKLIPIMEKGINSRILRRNSIPVRVLPSCAGEDVNVKSAADIVFERYLAV